MWGKLIQPVITLSIFAFLIWQAYHHSFLVGSIAVGATLAIFAFIFWDGARCRERLRASQHFLAHLACPACGSVFGDEIAQRALNPAPPSKTRMTELVFHDDFGMTMVKCDGCDRQYIYHRNAACLQWKNDDGEIVRIHANSSSADA